MTDAERLALMLQNRSVPMASPTGEFIPTQPLPMQSQVSPYNPIGIGETALSMGTGAIAQPIASIYGVGSQMFGGDGKQAANRLAEALTYQPTTEYGQATSQAFGEFADKSGLSSLPPYLGLPAPRMGAGSAKFAAQEYGMPVVEKGLSMYEQGRLTPGMKPVSEMEAWHGSPHDIKGNFDLAKVGAGAGNQAYGHGIYFGQARGTGEEYRKNLSSKVNYDESTKKYQLLNRENKIVGEFDNMAQVNKESEKLGNLYKVDIPDEQIPMMLDWDKPISQQSEGVLNAIKANEIKRTQSVLDQRLITKENLVKEGKDTSIVDRQIEVLKDEINNPSLPSQSGENYYNYLTRRNSPKEASKILNDLGITGIRYLDEKSRSKGSGTSNFVVFKPETVKILEKNDVPVTRKDLLKQEFDKLEK